MKFTTTMLKLMLSGFLMSAMMVLSGCAEIGLFSKTKTFSGTYAIKLDSARPDILDVLARVGKGIGYDVSGLNRESGSISLATSSSAAALLFYGGISHKTMSFTVADGGKTLNTSIFLLGDFGNGTQSESDRMFDQLNKALIADLQKPAK